MKNENYKISINVNANAKKAFDSICDVKAWWGSNIDGRTNKLNDVFTIHFGDTYVTFKITEFIPNKKIAWTVTESYLPWLKDKSEWTDTIVEWDIADNNSSTNITMTHIGLKPDVECYSNCEKGWNFYTGKSLASLINENKGLPDTPTPQR